MIVSELKDFLQNCDDSDVVVLVVSNDVPLREAFDIEQVARIQYNTDNRAQICFFPED